MIQMIPISELYPHPDNPRKDLGDLSELTASIKENGVLQNLTVVPGHKIMNEEWLKLSKEYDSNPSEELRVRMNQSEVDDGYTVVIGHRRLAAAKEAGLTELPCAVSDMDHKTQLATMLAENMQRSDLTIFEQAEGIQLLLNLGESVPDVSKRTGFSETTVRRRVKLLDLDREKFKESVERGATFSDYVKLEEIEDPKLKNKCLEVIGTKDFEWTFRNAKSIEEKRKKKARWIDIFNSFATEVKSEEGYERVGYSHYFGFDPDDFTVPADANETAYFYYIENTNYIILLKEKSSEKEIDPEAAKRIKEREEREQRVRELDAVAGTAYNLRREFVKNYIGKKDDIPVLIKVLLSEFLVSYDIVKDVAEILNIPFDPDEEYKDEFCDKPEFNKICSNHPAKVLLSAISASSDSPRESFRDWQGKFRNNKCLRRLYQLLTLLGYQTADEEQQFIDGTHEMYLKDEE